MGKSKILRLKMFCVAFVFLGLFQNAIARKGKSYKNFSTDITNIRNVASAQINGKQFIYISSLSDAVGCYTLEGEKVWENKLETPGVLFEILAKDITNDGNDELLVASGNGSIFCYKSNGDLLWKFTPDHKVRFSEIAVVKNKKKVQVFAGGNDYKLYEIDTKGKLVGTKDIKGTVRKIESGNFVDRNTESLFVMTYTHDKFRWEFMGILDATTKEVVKELSYKKSSVKELSKMMVTEIVIADLNKDGLSDITFFGDLSWIPVVIGLDGNFQEITRFKGTRKELQRYANAKGTVLAPVRDEIMFQYGGFLYKLDLTGKLLQKTGTRYAKSGELVFSDFVVDTESKQLIGAGQVDGGNTVCFYDLNKNNWNVATKPKSIGTMEEVANNINELYAQLLKFKMPSYQTPSDKEWVMITGKKVDAKVNKLKGNSVKYVIQRSPKESTDRSHLVAIMGDVALKKDKRGKYKDSRASIVNKARAYEAEGQVFTLWAGHGNDPFYIQIETLEEILKVAPNTCLGFVYAEMDNVDDPRVQHFVREYVPRLAKAIRVNNNAKLYFRYKNTFWSLTNKLPLWQELFFSNKYNDILVPASEDTSSRTQDINLAGRVGMLSAGYIDDFAMRLIDDNPTSWRPLTPGGQRSISPYLRQGVMMAAYGARYGVVADNSFTEEPGLNVLFGLMKSGVLPIVEKENILSIGSWHLIENVDTHLVHSIDNHHSLKQYKKSDDKAVFSVAQMHWAGTNIPESDYSQIALGVQYRWLNYIPELPNGMVPVAPIEMEEQLKAKGIPYTVSDGVNGKLNNEFVSAGDFAPYFKNTVAEGAAQLPILVKGAAWSAIRIDKNHVRVILMDQGYIEPHKRNAIISFQGEQPKTAVDILSNEKIKVKNNIELTVPAGSLRFIDFSY